MSSVFKFKKFEVEQSQNAMKIGTDAVLLGALVNLEDVDNVLDIGLGTGVISLMLAQRCHANILGIEIDKEASEECQFNFAQSPWSDRLEIIHGDVKEFDAHKKFDLVISNPPYFPSQSKSTNQKRNIARQQDSLNLHQLAKLNSTLLNEKGIHAVILPFQICKEYIAFCENQDLFCKRFIEVHGNLNSGPTRGVLEFGKTKVECNYENITIELNHRHQYSPEYLNLLRDFLFLE